MTTLTSKFDMQKASRRSGIIWPVIFVIAVFPILLSLGFWQLDRKAWKESLTAQIAERATATPVTLDVAEARVREGDGEYLRVSARGRFRHDHELFLWAPDPALGPGYHLYVPLEVSPGRYVFVNRGYVPEAARPADARGETREPVDTTVTGLVRQPVDPGFFTPANNIAANIWFWRDLDAMASTTFGLDGAAVLPLFIDAERDPAQAAPWPRGGTTRLSLTNRHLEYAWTWFGLAATLLAVFAAFLWSRRAKTTGR